MEEITMDQLPDVQKPEELVKVVQLPVIVEHLHTLKADIEKQTQEAMSLSCVPETVTTVKTARAEIRKRFEALEGQRKQVKSAIMERYDAFESVYRECVTDPISKADADLKNKITAVESEIIDDARNEMQEYFIELRAAHHIEWLQWEQLGIKIGMTEAKQKTHKKLRESIACIVAQVANDVNAIADMDSADEIMVEYQKNLKLSDAIGIVSGRHQRIADEQKRRTEWEATKQAEQKAIEKVEAAAPAAAPVPVEKPVEAVEKVFKLTFSVHGTREQLIKFKNNFVAYCNKEDIRYE